MVDRIGSGDAYISGALYGLLSSGGDCSKAIAFGNATAAVKNTIPGDLRPLIWKRSRPSSKLITSPVLRARWQDRREDGNLILTSEMLRITLLDFWEK